MLPNFSKLRLCPTAEFYDLPDATRDWLNADGGVETFTQEPHTNQQDSVMEAAPGRPTTFRVRGKNPLGDGTYPYTYYDPEGLWNWVRQEGRKVPLTQEPIWREDWWALHDAFAPTTRAPVWVRNLPQLDPQQPDTRAYGTPQPAAVVARTLDDHAREDVAHLMQETEYATEMPPAVSLPSFIDVLQGMAHNMRTNAFYIDAFFRALNDMDLRILVTDLFAIFRSGTANTGLYAVWKGDILRFFLPLADRPRFQVELRRQTNLTYILEWYRIAFNDQHPTPLEQASLQEQVERQQVLRAIKALRHHYVWDTRVHWSRHDVPPNALDDAMITDWNTQPDPPDADARTDTIQLLTERMDGVATYMMNLERYGPAMFLQGDPSDDEKCKDLLQGMAEMFDRLNTFRQSLVPIRYMDARAVRLARRLCKLAIRATWEYQKVQGHDPELAHFPLERLADAFLPPLQLAVTLSNGAAESAQPGMLANRELADAFFWRYVAPTYGFEVARRPGGNELDAHAVERAWFGRIRPRFEVFVPRVPPSRFRAGRALDDTTEEEDEDGEEEEETPQGPPEAQLPWNYDDEGEEGEEDVLEDEELLQALAQIDGRARPAGEATPNRRRQRTSASAA